jgi:hypothetical protein
MKKKNSEGGPGDNWVVQNPKWVDQKPHRLVQLVIDQTNKYHS